MHEDRSFILSWWVVSSPTPVGVMLKLSLYFKQLAWRNFLFPFFHLKNKFLSFFLSVVLVVFFSSKCAFRTQLSGLVFVSLLSLMKDHVDDEHIKRYREGFFYINIIIDTLCGGSFLACVLPGVICIKEAQIIDE